MVRLRRGRWTVAARRGATRGGGGGGLIGSIALPLASAEVLHILIHKFGVTRDVLSSGPMCLAFIFFFSSFISSLMY